VIALPQVAADLIDRAAFLPRLLLAIETARSQYRKWSCE